MLIKRVYEVDPMSCSKCGGQISVVSFIQPPRRKVIEKILRPDRLERSLSKLPTRTQNSSSSGPASHSGFTRFLRLCSVLPMEIKFPVSYQFKFFDQLSEVSAPVMVIGGDQEKIVPPAHARGFPDSTRVETIEGSGHMVQMESAGEVNRLIEDFVS